MTIRRFTQHQHRFTISAEVKEWAKKQFRCVTSRDHGFIVSLRAGGSIVFKNRSYRDVLTFYRDEHLKMVLERKRKVAA